MSIQAAIETKLKHAFAPERLEVVNESHLHAGHHHVEAGHVATFDGKGEPHFRVRIVAAAFNSSASAALTARADELKAGLHALAIEPAAPGEATRW